MATVTRIQLSPKNGTATEPDLPEPLRRFGPGGGMRRFATVDEDRRPGDCDIVFPQSVHQRILDHLSQDRGQELGGLLLGYELLAEDGRRSTVFITHSLPAPHTKGTSVSLTFPPETWAAFDAATEDLRRLDLPLQRVGWYHSHPNHGIFLSQLDLNVCQDFPRPTHLALVVDLHRDEGGFFVHGREGFRVKSPQGFWEFCDRQGATVVTWKNVRAIESRGQPSPPQGVVVSGRPPRRWPLVLAAGILAALAAVGTHYGTSRNYESVLQDLSQRMEQHEDEMRGQKDRLANAEAATKQAMQSATAAMESADQAEAARQAMAAARTQERALLRTRLDGMMREMEKFKVELGENK